MDTNAEIFDRCRRRARKDFGATNRARLLLAGMTPRAIDLRVDAGDLIREHPGTYVFGGTPSTRQQKMKCIEFWAGEGSAFSHQCAGHEWGLDGVDGQVLAITTPRRISAPGLIVHHGELTAREIRRYRSFPLTIPERTLMDLGTVIPSLNVEMATDSAFRLGLTTLQRLAGYVAARGGPGRRGSATLRRIVEERLLDAGCPASGLETRLRRIVLDSPLPRPEIQYEISDRTGFVARVDLAYPELNIAIEAEGWQFHMGRVIWKNDLRRRNALTRAGWRILHFTYDDIVGAPNYVIETIADLLAT